MSLRDKNVGDDVWVVGRHYARDGRLMVVAKVGRRWLTCQDGGGRLAYRFDRDTGAEDAGQYSPSAWAYPSREFYEERVRQSEAASAIRVVISSFAVNITAPAEDIRKAAELLGIAEGYERELGRKEAKR